MKQSIDVVARRTELLIALSGTGYEQRGGVFRVTIGGGVFERPIADGGRAEVIVPLAPLEVLPELPHALEILTGETVTQLAPSPVLASIDIRTRQDFMRRVQSLRLRIRDPELIRFCARRQLTLPDAAEDVCAAAICALGYRIVEGLDPADTDLPAFWEGVRVFLSRTAGNDKYVRWITSVSMVCTYVAILQQDVPGTLHHLGLTLSYRPHLPVLSLLHTNFSRSDILLSLLRAAQGDLASTERLLADVTEVFHVGARASWIDHPVRGRSQYSEIFAVLKSVRLAEQIRRSVRRAATREELIALAQRTSIGSVSGIMKQLEQRGHWGAVLSRLPPPAPDDPAHFVPLSVDADPRVDAAHATAAFRRDVSDLASLVARALAGEEPYRPSRIADALPAVMESDAALREAGAYPWDALLSLSKTRLQLAFMDLAGGDANAAYSMLTGTTRWTKAVMSEARIAEDREFETAGVFVLAGVASYVLAHRYVVPEAKHVAEAGIEADLARNLNRVFSDEEFTSRVITVFKAVAPETAAAAR